MRTRLSITENTELTGDRDKGWMPRTYGHEMKRISRVGGILFFEPFYYAFLVCLSIMSIYYAYLLCFRSMQNELTEIQIKQLE